MESFSKWIKNSKLTIEFMKKKFYFIILINVLMWVGAVYCIYYTLTGAMSSFEEYIVITLIPIFGTFSSRSKKKKPQPNKGAHTTKQIVKK